MWLLVKSSIRLESILCLQYFIWREQGEAVMISPAFSHLKLDDGSLMVHLQLKSS